MTLRSGHTHIDKNWQKSIDEAAEAGQEYIICSVLPSPGQTIENYQKSADMFNQAGEQCKKSGVMFGYHNHSSEFDTVDGQILYDVLLNRSQPNLVHMEMDLG
jgi:sugar phosphate isomerase/epimerase